MSLGKIKNIYRQHGHRFYRKGMTFSQESWTILQHAKYDASDNVIISSTFKNIGKMLDKNSSCDFSGYILYGLGMPPSVYKPLFLLDKARNYHFTMDPHFELSVLFDKTIKPLEAMTPEQMDNFKKEEYSNTALEITRINSFATRGKISLSEYEWEMLERKLDNIYKNLIEK